MRVKGLIDTGAIIALLDRDDRWHRACQDAFGEFLLPLATSAAVLAEVFHLVGDNPYEVEAAWTFLRSGAVTVLPIQDADVPMLHALMKKYADRPMDFADATLVHLAHREGCNPFSPSISMISRPPASTGANACGFSPLVRCGGSWVVKQNRRSKDPGKTMSTHARTRLRRARSNFPRDAIAGIPLCHFQVVADLKIQPKSRRGAEIASKTERGIGGNASAFTDNVIDARRWHSQRGGERVSRQPQGHHELFTKNLTRMNWPHCIHVVPA